ncbi:hypothetical protein [Mucilaginibacter agri]|uniref:DUF4136 domain-containing protein n=1 Tax=Mucilaginibacter agri TaxID=2695265 RepID=A0A965ZML3_9SPHI|nr:hypothetical protein [Mucilaginibacter agri]NCD72362.1 hypothetical protein [Mucilaginibacter agri]
MKQFRNLSMALLAALVISACGSSTSIVGSYKAPGVTQVAFKNIFVSALTANTSAKQSVETGMAQYLSTKGIAAVKSIDVFPPDFHSSGNDKDKETVLKAIRDKNCDGILTVALVNKETETHYVPGTGVYPAPGFGYYGTFGAYWAYGYNSFYQPGYYENDKVYYIETNLYDAASEKLVWSAQSKTYDPSSLDDFLKGYEKAISEQVVKDGLVAPAGK